MWIGMDFSTQPLYLIPCLRIVKEPFTTPWGG
jgi:hypothetical protein